jgi:hypothetical protein
MAALQTAGAAGISCSTLHTTFHHGRTLVYSMVAAMYRGCGHAKVVWT